MITKLFLTLVLLLNAVPQLQNSSFDEMTSAPDKDPVGWKVTEGYTIAGTGQEITQYPRMIQVISSDGAIVPVDGTMMLRNRAALGLKSNIKQLFAEPLTDTFELYVSIYLVPKYSQQIEFRNTASGQQAQLHFEDSGVSWCLAAKDVNNCVNFPPMPANRWNEIHFKFIRQAPLWRAVYILNGVRQSDSKGSGYYIDNSLFPADQIGSIFLGDECENPGCDGYGTVYYDNIH